jgi:glycosyltransferase involved in cell wall biosynthesis
VSDSSTAFHAPGPDCLHKVSGSPLPHPLRFLHLTTFYPPYSFGGDAMYVYRLCRALGDAGHHVDVVHCLDSYHLLHPGRPEIDFEEHDNVVRHPLQSRYRWLSPLLTQQTGRPLLKAREIRELLEGNLYDVVHFHNVSLLGPQMLSWQAARGRPVKLYTTHEHWLICPMHVLWKFNSRPCEKPECMRCTLRAGRPPQLWRQTSLLERASRHVDRFISPSRFTARMHAERGFPRPLGVLPYFTDRSDEDWQNPGPRPHARPYFLFVGRLERIKGLQTLIPLWQQVPEADLLVAGRGTYEADLRGMAAENPRIRFLGELPQRELGRLYVHALACIVPSLTYETFGMVNIEAFARKTPIIARNLGALLEVIEDSGGGFAYQSDEELLAAVHAIAGSPRLRLQLGERGYAAFVRNWSREAHLPMYFDLVRGIAREKFGVVPWEVEGPVTGELEGTVTGSANGRPAPRRSAPAAAASPLEALR